MDWTGLNLLRWWCCCVWLKRWQCGWCCLLPKLRQQMSWIDWTRSPAAWPHFEGAVFWLGWIVNQWDWDWGSCCLMSWDFDSSSFWEAERREKHFWIQDSTTKPNDLRSIYDPTRKKFLKLSKNYEQFTENVLEHTFIELINSSSKKDYELRRGESIEHA